MTRQESEGFVLKLEMPSDPELLSVVRGAVEQLAALAGLAEAECRAVTLAVDEALANIIRHAYGSRRGQPIEVTCRCVGAGTEIESSEAGERRHGPRLEFLLRDRGRGADPSELRGRPLSELRPGGLGTFFIQSGMDEVEYTRAGEWNHLRLVKYLAGERPAEAPGGE